MILDTVAPFGVLRESRGALGRTYQFSKSAEKLRKSIGMGRAPPSMAFGQYPYTDFDKLELQLSIISYISLPTIFFNVSNVLSAPPFEMEAQDITIRDFPMLLHECYE